MIIRLRNVDLRAKVLWAGTIIRVPGLYRVKIVSKRCT
jgi:hypothetical protein